MSRQGTAATSVPHRWHGGLEGNERLTDAVALVLLVLLALEAATTLDLSAYLAVHLFLGLLLLPAVSLKLASTGWRAARYYTGPSDYRTKGPPRILLRVLAVPLVAATLVLFGTGVAFLVTGDGGGILLELHVVSFGVWGVIMVVHVLAYLPQVLRHGLADWQPRHALAGAGPRRALVVGSLAAGAVLAVASYPAQTAWLSHHHDHGDRRAASRERRNPRQTTERSGFLPAPMRRVAAYVTLPSVALRCVIVDDNPAFLESASALLEQEGLTVVGTASTTNGALGQVRELLPDVVLLDIMLGGESGFDLARLLAEADLGSTVILISTHSESDFADLISETPAAGFIPKSELSARAIRRLLDA